MNRGNRGLSIEREYLIQDGTEWKFGAVLAPCIALITPSEREKYLPQGERQFGKEDFMDCVTRAYHNLIETKLTYLYLNGKLPDKEWFELKGYIVNNKFCLSDRFAAIGSGTTINGNSLKEPIDFIRKNGCIPKSMLPATSEMTFNQYINSNDITREMFKLGDEFLKRITIQYEQVSDVFFSGHSDMLVVCLHAWSNPHNGIYPRIEEIFNHAVMDIRPQYFVFDNYEESAGDFIKQLAPDYKFFDYGYRIILSITPPKKENIFLAILKAIAEALGLIQQEIKLLPSESVIIKTNEDHYNEVKDAITLPKRNLVREIAQAQTIFEGGPEDLNHRNNNPGNLTNEDGTFKKFKTWEEGMAALENYITRVAKGEHESYPKDCTILQYCHIYTSDKEPVPTDYALFICKKVGSPLFLGFKMSNLVS